MVLDFEGQQGFAEVLEREKGLGYETNLTFGWFGETAVAVVE